MVIRANTKAKTLIIVNNEDLSGIEHNQLLNLSDEGERWEGDVLNDQPLDWGVLYDKTMLEPMKDSVLAIWVYATVLTTTPILE